ncbi:DUF7344 domain-containing protein [Halosolutus halophilus]|uniref:DUF7344 domain-containing protein n=1 Tax=Halosolutus halophilus TaxID=1552990 RepID=UPI0022352F38|nr:hypothetical protein [Halosolutus halophilus]
MTARSTETDPTTAAFDALSSARRRYLLSLLLDRDESTPVSLSTLATDVATLEHDHPIVTDDQVRRSHVRLVHVDVPKLVDLGVVTRGEGRSNGGSNATDSTAGDAITLADHPVLEAGWVRTLLETPSGSVCDEATLDRTLEALRPPRRRTVLTVLAGQRGAVPMVDLATLVVAEETNGQRLVDVTEPVSTAVERALVHEHVPTLADADLVVTDDDGVAIAADAPQFDADWIAESPISAVSELGPESPIQRAPSPGPVTNARPGSTPTRGACWTIEGCEDVIARGNAIADRASEELFVTVSDRGRLQERCLERWSAAADRGVDVYVGSSSDRVREIVRAATDEITVCEPQFDWINLPIERIHPGRLVFADREAAMLVTIDDRGTAEQPRATAITGTGAENALVQLLDEHLGPRLDRLAARSEDADECDESVIPIPM